MGYREATRSSPFDQENFASSSTTLAKTHSLAPTSRRPHKEAAFHACDARTPVAEALGAVNTLWRQDGQLWGDNTDVAGFLANLDEATPGWDEGRGNWPWSSALAGLPAGIVYALLSRGFERVAIVNRTHARAEGLAAHFGGSTTAAPWADLATELARADLLVNASTLGMIGQPALTIELSALPEHAVVTDAVYIPLRTPLIGAAQRARVTRRGRVGDAASPSRALLRALVRQAPRCDPPVRCAGRSRGYRELQVDALIIAGLDGSIAMGKSGVTGRLRWVRLRPTFDADEAVRHFYAGEGAAVVEAAFPGVVVSGQVDRERLGSQVLGDPEALRRLEGIVHPAVAQARGSS